MSALAMIDRNLRKRGEDASFRSFTGNTGGDGVTSAPTPDYAAVTVRVMPWTATDEDAGGASNRLRRFVIGAEALTAAGVTEIKAQDKLTYGGVDYQVRSAEPVRSGAENLYFNVEAVR